MTKARNQEGLRKDLDRLVTIAEACRIAGIDRRVGQDYTHREIVIPTKVAGIHSGWNRYDRKQIVALAVAKAMADAGISLGFVRLYHGLFWKKDEDVHTDDWAASKDRYLSRIFDPFPDISTWPMHDRQQLKDVKGVVPYPSDWQRWPQFWAQVRDILPCGQSFLLKLEPTLWIPPFDTSKKLGFEARKKDSLLRLMDIEKMEEVESIHLINLASIKARVGQAIMDAGWLDE